MRLLRALWSGFLITTCAVGIFIALGIGLLFPVYLIGNGHPIAGVSFILCFLWVVISIGSYGGMVE
jgi:hypothetical protein